VRRPAGVADAGGPVQRLTVEQARREVGELPLGLRSGQVPVTVDDGDPGRVVAAVLQPRQRVHDDRDAVALSDVADDAAHGRSLPLFDPFSSPLVRDLAETYFVERGRDGLVGLTRSVERSAPLLSCLARLSRR